jgi:hypothetical protein
VSVLSLFSPLLIIALIVCTLGDVFLPHAQGWWASGLFSAQGGESWRLVTYSLFLGPPVQAILSLLTIALVAPGLENQRGGPLALAVRWLIATLALGACQKIGPVYYITGPTLVTVSLLTEAMLVARLQGQRAPWKSWWVLLAGSLVSAFLQGWVFPDLFLSLFLGALFTIASQSWLDRQSLGAGMRP